MNLKNRMIIEEYRESRDIFARLGEEVHKILKSIAEQENIEPMILEHRVKEEDSLSGKLELKGEKYRFLSDITDILGARFVCYFTDEVYKVADKIEEIFVVDWDNSVDKSKTLKEDTFGYLSVHYVCSLPEGRGYPEELTGRKFEIQLRSGLQHIWAATSHDITYKSEFDVPREVKRSFSRLAGIIELADEEFVRARNKMSDYTEEIHKKIIENSADDVLLNAVSLNEYIRRNIEMQHFLSRLGNIEGSEICAINAEPYLEQLRWLGMRTLGDVQNLLKRDGDLAFRLAEQFLSGSRLDILTSNVGLFYLCRAELLDKGYDLDKITEFFSISDTDRERAERQAKKLLKNHEKLKGE